MYSRVKNEPKTGGNDGAVAAEISISDSMSARVWKREVPPASGYYSPGICIQNFNWFSRLSVILSITVCVLARPQIISVTLGLSK